MGQIEVYEYLKRMRSSGEEKYFSISEVEKGLRDQGETNGTIQTVRGSLLRLELAGYLETKMKGTYKTWQRGFRIREKYTEKASDVHKRQ